VSTTTKSRAPSGAVEAWSLLRELFASHQPRFMAMFAEFGLAKQQAIALHLLDPERPVAMSALAGAMFCDASNITGIVDRLEDRGLVERRGADRDRRVKMVVLTENGAELRQRVIERMSEPPPALTALSPSDQRTLRDILRRALGH
jgi:MarR family transcriptional regulator, organic hydroperoxide resistance regulator